MKIMIIVNSYPPSMQVSARRWSNMVKYLTRKHNVQCTIITTCSDTYNDYFGPYGERILSLPIVKENKFNENTQLKRSFKGKLKYSFQFIIPLIFRDSSIIKWFWYFVKHSKINKLSIHYDCIVSSYGPLGPFLVGCWLSKKNKIPWIADIRDSFDSRDIGSLKLARNISRKIESFILRKANLRLTIGSMLSEHLSKSYSLNFVPIYNGWDDTDIVLRNNRAKMNHAHFLYYAGSIYPHRLPAFKVAALAMQKISHVKIKIRLRKDHTKGKLHKFISRLDYPERIEVLPPVDQSIVKKELSQSLAVLVFEDLTEFDPIRNGTVTGKLIGLMASGIPGIAISSTTGEIRKLVDSTPNWFGVETIEQFVNACHSIQTQVISKPAVNINALNQYHMENQANTFCKLLTNVI